MNIKDANIAIVHDWFLRNSSGGAEKVTLLINNFLIKNYTKPDLFSLVSDFKKTDKNNLKTQNVKTSLINSFPFAKENVQSYLPFLGFAIEQLDLSKYECVISSSHSFAKGILTSPDQLHISYIHTPMRYAWDQMNVYMKHSKLARSGLEIPIRYLLYKLREWDFSSSQRIDYLIANSNFTAKRIKKYWGLDSEVINPPVDIERFKYNKTRGNFYLSVNRLVPNKRIDLLIKAFNKSGLPLIIIGDGPERLKLEKFSNPNITFIKKATDFEVEEYMSRCRAFVYAGIEDFGIAPVEAMASGAPVIALGKGGILDTVNCLNNFDNNKIPNGILYKNQSSDDIFDAINWFEDKKIWREFKPEVLNNYSSKFSPSNFTNKLQYSINKEWNNLK